MSLKFAILFVYLKFAFISKFCTDSRNAKIKYHVVNYGGERPYAYKKAFHENVQFKCTFITPRPNGIIFRNIFIVFLNLQNETLLTNAFQIFWNNHKRKSNKENAVAIYLLKTPRFSRCNTVHKLNFYVTIQGKCRRYSSIQFFWRINISLVKNIGF